MKTSRNHLLALVGGGLLCALAASRLQDRPTGAPTTRLNGSAPSNHRQPSTDRDGQGRSTRQEPTRVAAGAPPIPRFSVAPVPNPPSTEIDWRSLPPGVPDPRDLAMYQALKLDPKQVAQVTTALRSMKEQTIALAADITAGRITREQWQEASDRLDRETDATLLAVLGPVKFREFEEYDGGEDEAALAARAAAVMQEATQ